MAFSGALRSTKSQLVGSPREDPGSLQEAMKLVDEMQKRARNYGEDLLEDMLTLDKLSRLVPEDRANRKIAIASLESLLGDIDGVKADLGLFRKAVEAKLEASNQECEQDAESTDAESALLCQDDEVDEM